MRKGEGETLGHRGPSAERARERVGESRVKDNKEEERVEGLCQSLIFAFALSQLLLLLLLLLLHRLLLIIPLAPQPPQSLPSSSSSSSSFSIYTRDRVSSVYLPLSAHCRRGAFSDGREAPEEESRADGNSTSATDFGKRAGKGSLLQDRGRGSDARGSGRFLRGNKITVG
jgi:hypothetical protein